MSKDVPQDLVDAAEAWTRLTRLRGQLGELAAQPLEVSAARQMKTLLQQADPAARDALLGAYWEACGDARPPQEPDQWTGAVA